MLLAYAAPVIPAALLARRWAGLAPGDCLIAGLLWLPWLVGTVLVAVTPTNDHRASCASLKGNP